MEAMGGQAVMEGVMMRSKTEYVVAVRKSPKKIVVKKEKIKQKPKLFELLFLRGMWALVENLVIGVKALIYSADAVSGEDEKITKKEFAGTLLFAAALTVGLFILLPLFLAGLVTNSSGVGFNLIDGFLRIAIFLLYLIIISMMPDIKRIFEYHGAEHKVINAYEKGEKLEVKNVRKYSTLHPRCGTAFLLIVFVISIIAFSVITSPNFFVKFGSRIILLPLIAGISYEILKLSDRLKDNLVTRIVIAPGLLLQTITTKEPDDSQIEVAIAAAKAIK